MSTNTGANVTLGLQAFKICSKFRDLRARSVDDAKSVGGLSKKHPSYAMRTETMGIETVAIETQKNHSLDRIVNHAKGAFMRLRNDLNGHGPNGTDLIIAINIPKELESLLANLG